MLGSGFDTFYCRFLASFMTGLNSSSDGFSQNRTQCCGTLLDIIAALLQENASILLSLLPVDIKHSQSCVQATSTSTSQD
jgi:hypothetical protein